MTAPAVDFYRSLWGPFTGDTKMLPAICAETVRRGYVGVETNPLLFGDAVDEARTMIQDHGLGFLARAHTFGRDVASHVELLKRTVDTSLRFSTPWVIVQSGVDRWGDTDVDAYFGEALAAEITFGVRLAHESHRGRILFSPWSTARALDRFPDLWLAADYSHWVIVAERFLDWEGDILQRCAPRVLHIDARVGDQESPQVRDPRTDDAATALAKFDEFWDQIHAASVARGDGLSVVPEFGPPPYEPYGAGDRDDICQWMAEHLRSRWPA